MSVLSNIDITEICEKLNIPLVGVYTKDLLIGENIKNNSAYIINTLNSGQNTIGHWVCIAIIDTIGIYFDSFGKSMPKEVYEFMRPCSSINYNNTKIQSLNESTCGWYCIGFLYYVFSNKGDILRNAQNYCNLFNKKDKKTNHKVLLNFMKNKLKLG